MKADMDRLMGERNLDAVIVLGDRTPNPYRDYLTNRAKADGIVIKKRGEGVVLIVSPLEHGEALKSGLQVYTTFDMGEGAVRKALAGQPERIAGEMLRVYLERLGITGRVGVYGVVDVFLAAALLSQQMPGVTFIIDYPSTDLFSAMYTTKDADEIARMKDVGRRAGEVVRRTWQFISEHRAEDGAVGSHVIDAQGKPLTIGAVKRFIRQQELELGLDDAEGVIFAQGKDAASPHSVGENDDVLQIGRTLVFDYFPRDVDSGYFHDMTRTWCIGQAPPEVQQAYDDVMHVYRDTKATLKVGASSRSFQITALEYFESQEHPTNRTHPGTLAGYFHGLGHGLGLNVHEAPYFGENRPDVSLAPGMVFTVEPGLYYPNAGFGVRVEDTVYLDQDGTLQTLTDFPTDLVLPLRGA
ncbi:MAG: aminopeptidase P family protein [Anaerolineae bacterium]|nr:aminopeptidase P family protein [Anaerolineae bacterium]